MPLNGASFLASVFVGSSLTINDAILSDDDVGYVLTAVAAPAVSLAPTFRSECIRSILVYRGRKTLLRSLLLGM